MNSLAALILIIVFLYTLVVTPVAFSKKSFEKFEKWRIKNKESLSRQEDELDALVGNAIQPAVVTVVTVIMYLLQMVFLLWVGRETAVNWFVIAVSSLEAISVSWNFTDSISKIRTEGTSQINRKRLIFSTIIDWVYCPMAIYLLLR